LDSAAQEQHRLPKKQEIQEKKILLWQYPLARTFTEPRRLSCELKSRKTSSLSEEQAVKLEVKNEDLLLQETDPRAEQTNPDWGSLAAIKELGIGRGPGNENWTQCWRILAQNRRTSSGEEKNRHSGENDLRRRTKNRCAKPNTYSGRTKIDRRNGNPGQILCARVADKTGDENKKTAAGKDLPVLPWQPKKSEWGIPSRDAGLACRRNPDREIHHGKIRSESYEDRVSRWKMAAPPLTKESTREQKESNKHKQNPSA
jgi:hypothetical protein